MVKVLEFFLLRFPKLMIKSKELLHIDTPDCSSDGDVVVVGRRRGRTPNLKEINFLKQNFPLQQKQY